MYNEKLTVNERIDAMEAMLNGNTGAQDKLAADSYGKAFWNHMHSGEITNELKMGSDGSGRYLIPTTYEEELVKKLECENFMRKIGTVVTTEHDMRLPVSLTEAEGGWVDEGGEISFMDAKFGQVKLGAHKLEVAFLITDELLEDSGIDLEKYAMEVFSEVIGENEEEAFLVGDGNGKPIGMIHQAEIGVTSEKVGEIIMDDMVDLVHSLKSPYRAKGVFVMSEDAYIKLRKIKFFDGRPAQQPSLVEGEPERLFGYDVYVSDYIPTVDGGNKPVLFGDFKYYWIGERGKRRFKRLSERFADHGLVGFVATQRMDGTLVLPEAVKSLVVKSEQKQIADCLGRFGGIALMYWWRYYDGKHKNCSSFVFSRRWYLCP